MFCELKRWLGVILAMGVVWGAAPSVYAVDDLIIYNSSDIAGDIPHIFAICRRTPDGEILPGGGQEGGYLDVYFDTGASGFIMSLESREGLGVIPVPGAQFADVGVAGKALFDVSEPLYVSLAPYETDVEPLESDFTQTFGPYRAMLTRTPGDLFVGGMDIFGVPLMAGKVVVIEPSFIDWDLWLLLNCSARVHDKDDPAIPEADIEIKLRMRNYVNTTDPENIGQLPTFAYNPVVDDITTHYNGLTSTGTWLLDTGASSSMISPKQAHQLGLTELDGTPIVPPLFWLDIGGVGGTLSVPLYQLDAISIPTLNGYNLVYDQYHVLVVEIGTIDEETGEPIILDGVLGATFYDTYDYGNYVDSPFHEVVIDADQALLGLVVDTTRLALPGHCGDGAHPRPEGDFNFDCIVDPLDAAMFTAYWLETCTPGDPNCPADFNEDGIVNMIDWSRLAAHWMEQTYPAVCGDATHPWREQDINRDCRVDLGDWAMLSDEWQRDDCNRLNWYCSRADANRDGSVNLLDLAIVVDDWLGRTFWN